MSAHEHISPDSAHAGPFRPAHRQQQPNKSPTGTPDLSALLLQMQRTAGNRAVNQFLHQYQSRTDQPTPRLATTARGASRPAAGAPEISPIVQRQPTGLAMSGTMAGVGSATDLLLSDQQWDQLSPELRARQMVAHASDALESLGAPRVTHLFGQQGVTSTGSQYGAFMPATWLIILKETPFQNGTSREERVGAAGTVYHEMRHAEQFFRIARLLASEHGMTPDQIKARIGLSEGIAKYAMATPLHDPQGKSKQAKKANKATKKLGGEAVKYRQAEYQEAVQWLSVVDKAPVAEGKGKASTTSVYAEVSARLGEARQNYAKTLQDLSEAVQEMQFMEKLGIKLPVEEETRATDHLHDAKAAFQKAWTIHKGLYIAYHMTPVEQDAWKVGGHMEQLLGGDPNTMDKELSNLEGNSKHHTFAPTTTAIQQPSQQVTNLQFMRLQRHALPEELQDVEGDQDQGQAQNEDESEEQH